METLIPINILVGDRTYRVRIEKDDEEVVRKTIKTINDKLIEFKTNFSGKDMQDYIAMVVLWYATTTIQGAATGGELTGKMNSFEALLDKALAK
jgi:hypothetical protein